MAEDTQKRFRGADLANQKDEHVKPGKGTSVGVLKGEDAQKVRDEQTKILDEEKKVRDDRAAQDEALRQADQPKEAEGSEGFENPDVDEEK